MMIALGPEDYGSLCRRPLAGLDRAVDGAALTVERAGLARKKQRAGHRCTELGTRRASAHAYETVRSAGISIVSPIVMRSIDTFSQREVGVADQCTETAECALDSLRSGQRIHRGRLRT